MIYTEDVREAVADADIIYTDMWLALTEKDNPPIERIRKLYPYRVDDKIMSLCVRMRYSCTACQPSTTTSQI